MAETVMFDLVTTALAERYVVLREVGSGGMAVVFSARDLRHEREVAIKVLRPDVAAFLGSAERFLREIKITARLNHPHILSLIDSGVIGELPYFVTPLVAGGSLRTLLKRNGTVSVAEVVRIVGQVAAGLGHAHQHGVIHRDIKPENILLSEGEALIADFGIARAVIEVGHEALTRSGFPLGTPGYMSPEQARGSTELDERTDVYGIGCVAYEMLIGEPPPFWPTDESVRLGRFLDCSDSDRERLAQLPGRMEQTLVRSVALKPGDRFATPVAFAEELAATATHGPGVADRTVHRVIGRAAELDAADTPTDDGLLSLGAVEQLGAEVGIAPELVRQAAVEVVEVDKTLAPRARREGSPGFDIGSRTLRVRAVVSGRVSDSDLTRMVDLIEREFGLGRISTTGGCLTWRPIRTGPGKRRVLVAIRDRGPATEIYVEEAIELDGGKILVPPLGAALGGAIGFAFFFGFGFPPQSGWFAIPAALFAAAGAIVTARSVLVTSANIKRPYLEDFAARLAGLVGTGGPVPQIEEGEAPGHDDRKRSG